MKVGLFIPCYIDQFYPQVGIAVYRFLVRQGISVDYPSGQTCCGQPLANSGMENESGKFTGKYLHVFSGFEYIVCPSGSCTLHVRGKMNIDPENSGGLYVKSHTFEFTEFLHDILRVKNIDASFNHKVALLQSCHGLRGLRLGSSTERQEAGFSKAEDILRLVSGIELVSIDRQDECCGFGGTFSIFEEPVSKRMGMDKLNACLDSGAEIITSYDMSCLMHLEGLAGREKLPVKFMHLAEIINGES